MEKLRQYLIGKSKADFAARLGIAPTYLSQILSGYRRPSFGLMCRIRDESAGAVRLDDWTPQSGRET